MLVTISEVDGQGDDIFVVDRINLPWVYIRDRDKTRKMHYTRIFQVPTVKVTNYRHWLKSGQMGGITNHIALINDSKFIIFSTMTAEEEDAALTAIREHKRVKGGQKYSIRNEKHLNKLMLRWQSKGYVECKE
jgi:hypothetical protein